MRDRTTTSPASPAVPSRRQWFKLAAGSALSLASWRVWAVPERSAQRRPRLVWVFLRGAYDNLHAVVPWADDFYYEARPNLAIPRPLAGAAGIADAPSGFARSHCVALDSRWGLHPSLAPSLAPLWNTGELAFVPFSGTEFVSRSHFQAQDWVEFGQSMVAGARPDGSSGFLNRLLDQLGAVPQSGVAFTGSLPPALRGSVQVVNAPVPRGASPALMAGPISYEARVMAMYAGHPDVALVREGLGLRRSIASEVQAELSAGMGAPLQDATASAASLASGAASAPGTFALEAGRMGRLLKDQPSYVAAAVEVGGWDTHAGQGAASGYLAGRLEALGQGLHSLSQGLGPEEWRRTVVVVMSEFGRTFRENGTRGTDHGHGSALWVLGGSVRGGRIRGDQAPLVPGLLHQDRDLPVLNEYRSVLGGLLTRLYGLRPGNVNLIFPGAQVQDLGLL